jgi:sigma-E factor negative regulatory protein RseA
MPMTDQIREQISALLDGELPKGEIGLLLRRMERDPGLRRSYESYVLAGEVLRSPGGIVASRGFSARVAAALEDGTSLPESAPVPLDRGSRRWLRPAAGVAVAAGAALAAVLLVRPDPDASARMAGQIQRTPPIRAVLPVGGASPTPEQNQRLAAFLVAHGQYATPIGRRAAWSNALATDPGITRVTIEIPEQR